MGIGSASFMTPRQAEKQALFSLGDRSVGEVILCMARGESYTQARRRRPEAILDETLYRERGADAEFPWDFIRSGVSRDRLYTEYLGATRKKVGPVGI
jgi:hypothetical protein